MPHMPTTTGCSEARIPFMVPMQVKHEIPRVSHQNIQASSRLSRKRLAKEFQPKKERRLMTYTIARYSGSDIQKALLGTPFSCPMKRSRIVPPPTDVTVPITIHPNRSIPLSAPASVPPREQQAVPIQSPSRSRPPGVKLGHLGMRSSTTGGVEGRFPSFLFFFPSSFSATMVQSKLVAEAMMLVTKGKACCELTLLCLHI
mmetsp:Transcript_7760/g.26181  ORF Transcript_7760/g.26181 Transcript_7760/m.26181 type:complete len:201 (+) Transcript_7760:463-1065(+)